MELERRFLSGHCEVRASKDGGKHIVGYAAVFNRLSQNLGGFVERVAPGAFAKTIQEADIRGLFNHDVSLVLGRNTIATLDLEEDKLGLRYEITPPDTQSARDLVALIERGDISGSSFSFRTIDDEWGVTEQDFPVRTLKEVKLFDVGPVTFPAYLDTEAGLRCALHSLAEGRDLDELVAAAGRNELRSFIPGQTPEPHSTSTYDQGAARSRSLELARRRHIDAA